MIKESLAIDLRSMLKKAFSGINIIKKENIPLRHGNILRQVNLTVLPMAGSYPDEKLYIVVFEEAKNVKPAKDTSQGKTKKTNTEEANRFAMLKKELENTKDHLQAIIEQQESTNEELRAANEEIQSSNEELQSTNEELETAKEELQSTNEELTTVNEELQNRNAELQSLNNDLNNLLVSINIPVIILDHNLKIRRFTKVTERIFNIIPLDIGRKITDLNLGFEIPDFEKQLHAVIDLPCIKEINIKDKNENWYSMRIRPYKTTDNKIDGVVLALVEISGLRKSIDSLTESKMEAESLNKVLRLKDRARIKEFEKASTTFETQMLAAKNAEEALRILSHHLVEGQESERLKISRDLHDSVNQMLTAVKIKIHGIIKKSGGMNGSKSLAGDLENINKMLNDSINEIRRITKNLRPGMIDDLGLDIALKSLIDEFRERNKIRLTYTGNKIDGKLSKDSELTVYRVIQEALQNIEKHSEAKQVNIQLKLDKSMLSLVIKDNGKGFKPEGNFKSNIAKKKFGLISMKERVESVGGRLEIKSKIPNGTKIMIEIPVKNKKIK
jgi:signal transduction histidine kinase